MNEGRSRFDLSVIIPLDDDHGFGERCIDSWNRQTYPRSRLQLVIVDPGNRQKLIGRIGSRLAAHDLLLTVTGDNEGLLYDRGTRAAKADLVLTTEGHCVAEPHAAEEIVRTFADPAVAAVNGGSTHIEPTTIAAQQSLLEKDWLAIWPLRHWRAVSLRAFAFRRELYERLGGFRQEHRRFCANAFAVELDRHGFRFAGTASPIVKHCNSPTMFDMVTTLRDCARGQIVWRAELERNKQTETADRYLGGLDFWSRRGDLAPKVARRLAGALLLSIVPNLNRPGSFAKARHSLADLARFGAAGLLGPRASAWKQRISLVWTVMICAAASVHKRGLYQIYRRLWCKSFDSGFADYATAYPVQPQWFAPGAEPIAFASLPDGAVAGFHAREGWGEQGPLIRWSGSAFLLRLYLTPGNSHTVVLDIRSDVPLGERCLRVFFNGSPLPLSAVQEEKERLAIMLPSKDSRMDGRQELIVTCRTMRPSDRGETDARRLGLAVFAIDSQALLPQDDRVALGKRPPQ